eukprot:3472070-Ditylum_brightwellii.AAC.1
MSLMTLFYMLELLLGVGSHWSRILRDLHLALAMVERLMKSSHLSLSTVVVLYASISELKVSTVVNTSAL